MGTWGSGSFDNDDAGDWTYGLTSDADESVVERALAAVAADGVPDAPTSQAAIAAAEVVAAGLGRPSPSLPAEVAEWVGARDQTSWRALVPLALQAIDRILAGSELKELWAESQDDRDWTAGVQDLRERLTAQPTIDQTPIAARSTRAPFNDPVLGLLREVPESFLRLPPDEQNWRGRLWLVLFASGQEIAYAWSVALEDESLIAEMKARIANVPDEAFPKMVDGRLSLDGGRGGRAGWAARSDPDPGEG